ncbi:ICOS ligand-like [Enoplosus armatus]|uniref:ICOS ligand-like n=1 Tax=Enoplosus armatus TaxID=215367 RepID=UPI0039959817
MSAVLVAYCLLFVPGATAAVEVNATVGQSVVLPCALVTAAPVDLKKLRFYWQDEGNYVLYSFNEGKERPEHVNELYRGRIAAFPEHMSGGNVSVKVKNVTLGDNQKLFQVFAAVFDSGGTRRYSLKHMEICQIAVHVAVPFKSVRLAVNDATRAAACTAHTGFPKPLVKWRLQHLFNNSLHLLDQGGVHTTTVQDPKDQLYSFSSTINIPGGRYESVTCVVDNPTLNVTVTATHVLNTGEAQRSPPGWAVGLMVAAVVLRA